MKASVKLREGKEPLLRAKLPVSVLGVPLAPGLTIGSSSELGIHLSTGFHGGPSCRLTVWPNDPVAPVRLLFKAGLGLWGSAAGACLAMSAEFTLPAQPQQQPPSISIFIKPRLGDFSLAKRTSYTPPRPMPTPELKRWKLVDMSVAERVRVFQSDPKQEEQEQQQEKEQQQRLNECMRGWNLVANSRLPLGNRMQAAVKWRVAVPEDVVRKLSIDPSSCLQRLPVLRLDKITILERQQVVKPSTTTSQQQVQQQEEPGSRELSKVAVMCFSMKRQIQLLRAENQVLKSTMEDVVAKTSSSNNGVPGNVYNIAGASLEPSLQVQEQEQEQEQEKVVAVPDELRKALMSSTGARR